jgi:hypothetical protein
MKLNCQQAGKECGENGGVFFSHCGLRQASDRHPEPNYVMTSDQPPTSLQPASNQPSTSIKSAFNQFPTNLQPASNQPSTSFQ